MMRRALEDGELKSVQAFVFGNKPDFTASAHTPDLVLLSAISQKDANAFRSQVSDLEQRRISPGAAWCDNDCLVFCLLLGCEIFETDSSLVKSVLDAREQNRNSVPRKVNEVFRSLSRKERAMVEEFAFIKVVYEHIRGQLNLSTDDAIKVYNDLIQPHFFEELSPFISLLALRAHDLIITERKPSVLESFPQLIVAIEKLGNKLSIRQLFQLLMALPLKSLLVIGGIAFTIFGTGVTTQKFTSSFSFPASRPELLKIVSVQDGQKSYDHLLDTLASSLIATHQAHTGKTLKLLLVKTDAVGTATSKYSVELSILTMPVLDGYAFSVKDSDIGPQRAVIPVRSSGEVLKALIPSSDGSSKNEFLLLIETPSPADNNMLTHELVVRVIE